MTLSTMSSTLSTVSKKCPLRQQGWILADVNLIGGPPTPTPISPPVFGELARVGNLVLVVFDLTLFFGRHAVNQHNSRFGAARSMQAPVSPAYCLFAISRASGNSRGDSI